MVSASGSMDVVRKSGPSQSGSAYCTAGIAEDLDQSRRRRKSRESRHDEITSLLGMPHVAGSLQPVDELSLAQAWSGKEYEPGWHGLRSGCAAGSGVTPIGSRARPPGTGCAQIKGVLPEGFDVVGDRGGRAPCAAGQSLVMGADIGHARQRTRSRQRYRHHQRQSRTCVSRRRAHIQSASIPVSFCCVLMMIAAVGDARGRIDQDHHHLGTVGALHEERDHVVEFDGALDARRMHRDIA